MCYWRRFNFLCTHFGDWVCHCQWAADYRLPIHVMCNYPERILPDCDWLDISCTYCLTVRTGPDSKVPCIGVCLSQRRVEEISMQRPTRSGRPLYLPPLPAPILRPQDAVQRVLQADLQLVQLLTPQESSNATNTQYYVAAGSSPTHIPERGCSCPAEALPPMPFTGVDQPFWSSINQRYMGNKPPPDLGGSRLSREERTQRSEENIEQFERRMDGLSIPELLRFYQSNSCLKGWTNRR